MLLINPKHKQTGLHAEMSTHNSCAPSVLITAPLHCFPPAARRPPLPPVGGSDSCGEHLKREHIRSTSLFIIPRKCSPITDKHIRSSNATRTHTRVNKLTRSFLIKTWGWGGGRKSSRFTVILPFRSKMAFFPSLRSHKMAWRLFLAGLQARARTHKHISALQMSRQSSLFMFPGRALHQ